MMMDVMHQMASGSMPFPDCGMKGVSSNQRSVRQPCFLAFAPTLRLKRHQDD